MNSQEQLEYMVKNMAARINAGWTNETNEDGEHLDEDGYPTSAYDFIADALNLEFTVDHRLEYRAAQIWTTVGGPSIWIETNGDHGYVYGSWGSDKAEAVYSDGGELDNAAEELYSSIRGH